MSASLLSIMPVQAHKGGSITRDGFSLRTMTWQGSIAKALAGKVVRDTTSASIYTPDLHSAAPETKPTRSAAPPPPPPSRARSLTLRDLPQPTARPNKPSGVISSKQNGGPVDAVGSPTATAAPWRSSRVQLQKASSLTQDLPASPRDASSMRRVAPGAPRTPQKGAGQDTSTSSADFASCQSEVDFGSVRSDADSALSALDDPSLQHWQHRSGERNGPSEHGDNDDSLAPQQVANRSSSGVGRLEFSPMRQQSVAKLDDAPMGVAAQDAFRQPTVTDLPDEPNPSSEADQAASAETMQAPDASRSSFDQPAARPETQARERLTSAQWLPVQKPTGLPVQEPTERFRIRTNMATSVYDVSRLAGTVPLTQILAGVLHAYILGKEPAGEVIQAISQTLLSKLQALEVK